MRNLQRVGAHASVLRVVSGSRIPNHPPRRPQDLRHLNRRLTPPVRQAISSRGPTRTVKQMSTPPPISTLRSPIVPTLTPPPSTTATTMTSTTPTTKRSNSHSRRSSTSSSWAPTTSNKHSRRRSTSSRWHRILTGSSRHRHHFSSISNLQVIPRLLPLRLLPQYLQLLRPRCIY